MKNLLRQIGYGFILGFIIYFTHRLLHSLSNPAWQPIEAMPTGEGPAITLNGSWEMKGDRWEGFKNGDISAVETSDLVFVPTGWRLKEDQ